MDTVHNETFFKLKACAISLSWCLCMEAMALTCSLPRTAIANQQPGFFSKSLKRARLPLESFKDTILSSSAGKVKSGASSL